MKSGSDPFEVNPDGRRGPDHIAVVGVALLKLFQVVKRLSDQVRPTLPENVSALVKKRFVYFSGPLTIGGRHGVRIIVYLVEQAVRAKIFLISKAFSDYSRNTHKLLVAPM
ncbi:hypothetical protein W911_06840 [Hyphomicrobium nitrativorans NL23]|uniref:Uncharacterized protein n=1 Tax=Hyphomicrobium nitrativorans NL23 TaxID=1029756 RepID=V5SGR3_9HYPH|nr:hypothetical protein W911_06840 [Hyphomicrobium nitrativorans NL23]